jgi:hypothetical protein
MYPAPRRRDEYRTRLHGRELILADHANRGRDLRTVDRNEVGYGKQLVEFDLAGAAARHFVGIDVRVGRNDVHGEGLGHRGDDRADVADADEAERPAREFVAHQVFAGVAARRAQLAIGLGDALRQVQHQTQGVLGDGAGIPACLIAEQHAGARAGIEVGGVVAGACRGDDKQVRRPGEEVVGRPPALLEIILAGADVIRVGLLEGGPGGCFIVLLEEDEIDVALILKAGDEIGMDPEVETHNGLARRGHRVSLSGMSTI